MLSNDYIQQSSQSSQCSLTWSTAGYFVSRSIAVSVTRSAYLLFARGIRTKNALQLGTNIAIQSRSSYAVEWPSPMYVQARLRGKVIQLILGTLQQLSSHEKCLGNAAVGRPPQRPVGYDLRKQLSGFGRGRSYKQTPSHSCYPLPFCPQAALFDINHLLHFLSTSNVQFNHYYSSASLCYHLPRVYQPEYIRSVPGGSKHLRVELLQVHTVKNVEFVQGCRSSFVFCARCFQTGWKGFQHRTSVFGEPSEHVLSLPSPAKREALKKRSYLCPNSKLLTVCI